MSQSHAPTDSALSLVPDTSFSRPAIHYRRANAGRRAWWTEPAQHYSGFPANRTKGLAKYALELAALDSRRVRTIMPRRSSALVR
jgi:hypothetical protein